MEDKRTAALEWAARGFRVFPLAVGKKTPTDKDWPALATSDPATIERMWTDPVMGWSRDYNIGVLTDDLIVIDIDVKNGKKGDESFVALDLPTATLTVRTPTGGRHVYYSGPSRSLSANRLGDGLDVRSFHGYVLAPGSEVDSGVYALDRDDPILAVPAGLLALLDAPRERSDTAPLIDLDAPEALERAAYYLKNEATVSTEGQGGDERAYKVAAVVKDFGLSEDAAFELMVEHWNERCSPPWALDELRTKVENAYRYGTLPPGVASPQIDFAGLDMSGLEAAAPRPPGDWFHHGDDWSLEATWLYHSMLPRTGVAVLTGRSGDGKTFLAVHLAHSLATGGAFFGVEPEERGGTMLLASESLSSVKRRLAALGGGAGRLPIAARYVTGLGVKGALQSLLEDLQREGRNLMDSYGVVPRLVILDTLSASGLLTDEDDNALAAAAISALQRASEALGCLFLIVHHPPKDGRGMRGAGAIGNNADYVLEVVREGRSKVRELELTKSRDAETRTLGAFTLVPVDLGRDSKGALVESCIVTTGVKERSADGGSAEHAALLVECTEWALIEEGGMLLDRQIVELEAVRALYKERKTGSRDRSNIAKTFVSALTWAEETGAVESLVHDGRKYLTLRRFEP